MSGTPPRFSCKSISVKQGDGTWRANPPFFRQRAERSGTSPLRHLLQLEGCLQRTARRRAPCGGCQNISRLPQATEYQEYLADRKSLPTPPRDKKKWRDCLKGDDSSFQLADLGWSIPEIMGRTTRKILSALLLPAVVALPGDDEVHPGSCALDAHRCSGFLHRAHIGIPCIWS